MSILDERIITKHRNDTPYLDTLSCGSQTNFQSFPLHKKLLVQPITLPDLSHLGISTKINGGGPEVEAQNRYANFDGSVTNSLRNIVRRVPQAIREDYRKADLMAKEQRYLKQQQNKNKQKNRRQRRNRPPSVESLTPSEVSRMGAERYEDGDSDGGDLDLEEAKDETGIQRYDEYT